MRLPSQTSLIDSICDRLWDSAREHYVDAEYDEKGELLYDPPALDDAWLSDEDQHHKLQDLREQAARHKRKMKERDRESWRRLDEEVNNTPTEEPPSQRRAVSDDEYSDGDENDSLSGSTS